MPEAFEKCVREGGNIITKKLPDNKYMHICYDKNGKSYPGEIKTKKPSKNKKTVDKMSKW